MVRLIVLIFIKIGLKLSYFCQKNTKFSMLQGASLQTPEPPPPLQISGSAPAERDYISKNYFPKFALTNCCTYSGLITLFFLYRVSQAVNLGLTHAALKLSTFLALNLLKKVTEIYESYLRIKRHKTQNSLFSVIHETFTNRVRSFFSKFIAEGFPCRLSAVAFLRASISIEMR